MADTVCRFIGLHRNAFSIDGSDTTNRRLWTGCLIIHLPEFRIVIRSERQRSYYSGTSKLCLNGAIEIGETLAFAAVIKPVLLRVTLNVLNTKGDVYGSVGNLIPSVDSCVPAVVCWCVRVYVRGCIARAYVRAFMPFPLYRTIMRKRIQRNNTHAIIILRRHSRQANNVPSMLTRYSLAKVLYAMKA